MERAPRGNWSLSTAGVQAELSRTLRDPGYTFVGKSLASTSEARVQGEYYSKAVDVLVRRAEETLAVVSIKFVMSNYWQNAVNYFEQQLGETANLRRQNLVYGNLLFLPNPIPYRLRSGATTKLEQLRDRDIERYARLRRDHRHAHAPDEMGVGVLDLDADHRTITALSTRKTLELDDDSWRLLENELSVARFFDRMALRIQLRHLSP